MVSGGLVDARHWVVDKDVGFRITQEELDAKKEEFFAKGGEIKRMGSADPVRKSLINGLLEDEETTRSIIENTVGGFHGNFILKTSVMQG